MSEKFKAIVIDNQNEKFIHLLEENCVIRGFIRPNLVIDHNIDNLDL